MAPGFPAACWQVTWVPSHVSVVHGFPSSAHAVPVACLASAGQSGPSPGQCSVRSHSPAGVRQTVLEDWKRSGGQLGLLPVHVSATSQAPAATRQMVPALPGLWTHAGAPTVPLHASVVQTLPSSVHAVPAVLTRSVGQVGLEPGQVSGRSHSFAAARQTVPALPGLWTHAGVPTVPLHTSVVQTLPSSVHAV